VEFEQATDWQPKVGEPVRYRGTYREARGATGWLIELVGDQAGVAVGDEMQLWPLAALMPDPTPVTAQLPAVLRVLAQRYDPAVLLSTEQRAAVLAERERLAAQWETMWEDSHATANRQGLCSTYDAFIVRFNAPPRPRPTAMTAKVEVRVTVTFEELLKALRRFLPAALTIENRGQPDLPLTMSLVSVVNSNYTAPVGICRCADVVVLPDGKDPGLIDIDRVLRTLQLPVSLGRSKGTEISVLSRHCTNCAGAAR
jgi:hypothetical protein